MHTAIEVIEGRTPALITFHLEPLGNLGTPCDFEVGLIGENLNRAIRLKNSGSATVEVGTGWWIQHSVKWREEVIDLALQQFETIPGGQ